jgi:VanZ family protein
MTAPAVQRISSRLRIFFAHSSRTAMYWRTSVWRLLALAWAAEIFWMSTGTFAPGFSRSVEWSFLRLLHVHLPTETFLILHAISRKLAHLGEYGLLGFLVYRSLGGQIRVCWQPRLAFWSVVTASVYSLTDEFHQLFARGRGASLFDCGIDTAGAAIAMLLVYAYSRRVDLVSWDRASS